VFSLPLVSSLVVGGRRWRANIPTQVDLTRFQAAARLLQQFPRQPTGFAL